MQLTWKNTYIIYYRVDPASADRSEGAILINVGANTCILNCILNYLTLIVGEFRRRSAIFKIVAAMCG